MKKPGQPILEIKDVVKDFGGIRAVNHCFLNVRRGTSTGLRGPNGAGKITLFNLATGFVRCNNDRILSGGRRIDGLSPHEIFRQGIVRAFQIPGELKRMTTLCSCLLTIWVSNCGVAGYGEPEILHHISNRI